VSQSDEFVPLSERVGMLMAFRIFAAIAAVALQLSLVPSANAGQQIAIVVAYLGVTGLLSAPVRTGHRNLTLRAFGIALLADGLFLQGERVLGDPTGMEVLVAAYLAAVALLASFRTGLKVALWHSLLMLLAHQAAQRGKLDTAATAPLRDTHAMIAYLAILWFTVLTTASFAAVNERELRRRRYDSDALRRFAVSLAAAETQPEVFERLLGFCREELGAVRGAVVSLDPKGYRLEAGDGLAENVDSLLDEVDNAVAAHSALLSAESASTTARTVYRLGRSDRWLATVLPDAHRLVSLPLVGAANPSCVVLELPGRGSRLERRIVGTAAHACGAATLASSRTALLAQLRAAASTDGLTKVANRRSFDDALAQLRQSPGSVSSLIIVDVDHFKRVNDEHGHQVGDEVLQRVAAVLHGVAKRQGMVARYGGEEFVVLLPRTAEHEAATLAEQMRHAVQVDRGPVPVTASFGVATATSAQLVDSLVSRADQALYDAKHGGRNRVQVSGATPLSLVPPAA
jgi:two-component system cell cycle response regulator